MLTLVRQAYAVTQQHVRLICSDVGDDGKLKQLLCTQARHPVRAMRAACLTHPRSRGRTRTHARARAQGTGSMAAHIAAVFGAKFIQSLLPVEIQLDVAAAGTEAAQAAAQSTADAAAEEAEREAGEDCRSTPAAVAATSAQVDGPAATAVGFVSRVGDGIGRSNSERQFISINGRPVDAPKVPDAARTAACRAARMLTSACSWHGL